jgi:nucleoside-diphosphate-sugar epimerase
MLPAVAGPDAPTAIVTGARGFVGAAVLRRLRADGHRVIGIDLPAVIGRRHDFVGWRAHDLTAPLPPDALAGVELVIHAAALAGVQPSWERPGDYWRTNVVATELLRAACEQAGSARVIHLSSISVYGQGEALVEQTEARPLSPYGVSKLAGEAAWRGYSNTTIVRLSNVYGPGQRPDMAYATFIRAALSGRHVELRDGGRQLRTPTYIDDCVDGIVAAASAAARAAVYNLAGPQHVKLAEVHRLLERLLGRAIPTVRAPRAPGDPRVATVSSVRAARELGYQPRVWLAEGLARQLQAARAPVSAETPRARIATA